MKTLLGIIGGILIGALLGWLENIRVDEAQHAAAALQQLVIVEPGSKDIPYCYAYVKGPESNGLLTDDIKPHADGHCDPEDVPLWKIRRHVWEIW